MDPITQGALGAAAAQLGVGRKLGERTWLYGCLGGMAADLDVLIRSSSDPLISIIYHRHFTRLGKGVREVAAAAGYEPQHRARLSAHAARGRAPRRGLVMAWRVGCEQGSQYHEFLVQFQILVTPAGASCLAIASLLD